jgi:hypothetical protein
MAAKIVLGVLGVLVIGVAISIYPDLRRYIKISTM